MGSGVSNMLRGRRAMALKSQSLTEGPLARRILVFSTPLVLSNLLQVLFNMSDIAVVGRFAGAQALGAVGSTVILVGLFTGFLMGMGSGVNVLVARYIGAESRADVEETVHTSLLISLAAGLILFAVGAGFSRLMLRLLNTKAELLDGAALYMRIYFLGMPAAAIYNFGNAVFSAAGNTRRPLFYLMIAGALNVAMNLFFVIFCRMGVAGVALASTLSQYLCAGLILAALLRSRESYALHIRSLRVTPEKARFVLALGVPSGAQNSVFSLANLFIQRGVNSFDAIVVEGNAAAANADALVYDVMAAFYTACASFTSQNLGAGRKERILRIYAISLAYSFGAGALLGLSLAAFGDSFLSLFTADAAVVAAGMTRLRVMGLSYAFSAFMDCTIAASRGLGKSFAPMVIVFLGSCAFRVLWVYTVFAWFGTILSLYLLYIFSWAITAAAEIWYFVRAYKREMALLEPVLNGVSVSVDAERKCHPFS